MDEEATSQTQLNDTLGKQLLKSQQISCMRKEKKMGEEVIVAEFFFFKCLRDKNRIQCVGLV